MKANDGIERIYKKLLRFEQQHFFQIKGVIDYVRIRAFRHPESWPGDTHVTDFDPLPVCEAEIRDIYQSVIVRLSYEQWQPSSHRHSQSLHLQALHQHTPGVLIL